MNKMVQVYDKHCTSKEYENFNWLFAREFFEYYLRRCSFHHYIDSTKFSATLPGAKKSEEVLARIQSRYNKLKKQLIVRLDTTECRERS